MYYYCFIKYIKYADLLWNPGDMIKRIVESRFPGRFVINGNNKFVTVPSQVIQRMALVHGDYLDVTIRLPET